MSLIVAQPPTVYSRTASAHYAEESFVRDGGAQEEWDLQGVGEVGAHGGQVGDCVDAGPAWVRCRAITRPQQDDQNTALTRRDRHLASSDPAGAFLCGDWHARYPSSSEHRSEVTVVFDTVDRLGWSRAGY